MPSPIPSERKLAAEIAAHTRWALEPDRSEATKPAREAFLARFERQIPDYITDEEERRRRARSLRSAHFQRLALASARARRKARSE